MVANFRALVVRETAEGRFERGIEQRSLDDLPAGDVLVRVRYSSLNYKDALSASGNKGVTRRYPHTPGIDAAGVVEHCDQAGFAPGEEVLIGSAEFGANYPGGFSEYSRVPASWVYVLPAGLTLRGSMSYGTAGITAALSVLRLQEYGLTPGAGEVLVTGATGGVGSLAVAILARTGYTVVAASGKPAAASKLAGLGAHDVIERAEVNDTSGKALLKGRWAGVVDTVGGNILATAIKTTRYGGVVTCCGNAASLELSTTVYPFILRAVSLVGIDVANCPPSLRRQLWEKLAREWRLDASRLATIITECGLDELDVEIERTLQGQRVGRVVVRDLIRFSFYTGLAYDDVTMDLATVDHLLTTTRSVRKRLDLYRPVEPEVIERCIEIAIQAPTASNSQRWHFVIVTEKTQRAAVAAQYQRSFALYLEGLREQDARERANLADPRAAQNVRVRESAIYLSDHMHEVPVLIIPCIEGRVENAGQQAQAGTYGSILPAAWSLMLALRARGLGSAWTTLHLRYEQEVAAILGIPDTMTQAALLPVAYFTGDDFKPAARMPIKDRLHWNAWDQKSFAD